MELPASSPFRHAGRSAGPLRATGREPAVYTRFELLVGGLLKNLVILPALAVSWVLSDRR